LFAAAFVEGSEAPDFFRSSEKDGIPVGFGAAAAFFVREEKSNALDDVDAEDLVSFAFGAIEEPSTALAAFDKAFKAKVFEATEGCGMGELTAPSADDGTGSEDNSAAFVGAADFTSATGAITAGFASGSRILVSFGSSTDLSVWWVAISLDATGVIGLV